MDYTTKEPFDSRRSKKRQCDDDIRVEQIDDNFNELNMADVKTTKVHPVDKTRLTLPSADNDDRSDASSLSSPISGSHEDLSRTDDESIAVDCRNPSEVIVKGKNVNQIRVKFRPHPPSADGKTRARSAGRPKPSRSLSRTSKSGDDVIMSRFEELPFSQEETSEPANLEHHAYAPTRHMELHRMDSVATVCSQVVPSDSYHSIAAASEQNTARIDWDQKHRHDVLSGLEYFESKAANYKDLYNRSQQELNLLKAKKLELEEHIEKLKQINASFMEENNEVKIKLDEQEKENAILHEQAVSEWQSRVKAEELFVELQRDSTNEIAALKKKLSEQTAKPVQEDCVDGAFHNKQSAKGGLSDEKFELMHTIGCLQDDIKRLTREKDVSTEISNKLKLDLAEAKEALKQKSHELESQYRRFVSLKKSFNDVVEENEKLKTRRPGGQHTREQVTNSLANSTWPAATKGSMTEESVSKIDLPNVLPKSCVGSVPFKTSPPSLKVRRGSIGQKHVKSPGKHQRTRSDVGVADNLPPVINPSR